MRHTISQRAGTHPSKHIEIAIVVNIGSAYRRFVLINERQCPCTFGKVSVAIIDVQPVKQKGRIAKRFVAATCYIQVHILIAICIKKQSVGIFIYSSDGK